VTYELKEAHAGVLNAYRELRSDRSNVLGQRISDVLLQLRTDPDEVRGVHAFANGVLAKEVGFDRDTWLIVYIRLDADKLILLHYIGPTIGEAARQEGRRWTSESPHGEDAAGSS
jgi:hypothetical protein